MKTKTLITLFIFFNCFSIITVAQDGFTNKDEATNQYRDSLKQGKWIEYTDALYRPSIKGSQFTTYYRLSIYTNGKENGMVRYYSTYPGKLHEELPYTDGKRNGIDRIYYDDGHVEWESFYINDKMNGADRMYDEDHRLIFEMPITDDKINGVTKKYYGNGQLQEETPYSYDKQNGVMKEYDTAGRILSETPYINGKIQGIKNDYCYYDDGKLWWEAFVDTDQKGIEKLYNENGSLLETDSVNGEEEHFEWEEKDKKIINSVLKLDRNNTREVEKLFLSGVTVTADTLGFGWRQSQLCLNGGNININATFYYYKDSIISYTLQPWIFPNDYQANIRRKYMQWYYPYFTELDTIKYTERNGTKAQRIVMHPFKYNEQGILQPLKEYNAVRNKQSALPEKILEYMSPETTIAYGWYGGLPPTIFTNRKAFNEIKDSLADDEIVALLYSINPASRLTAIEYCIKNNNPLIAKRKIKKWISKVYKEVPRMQTASGCILYSEDSKTLVERYSKNNLK
jgi:antitoxin component YwqK of YwqJK toxin-antitoxin module